VRHPVRPARRGLHHAAGQGTTLRGRHRRHGARDPHRAAGGGRRAAGGQGVRRGGQGTGPRRGGLPRAEPGPAGHRHRQRGARLRPRRRDPAAAVRQAAADGDHARRPAGLGQDDAGRQARPVAARPGAHPAAGRRRPPAAERGHPAAGGRPPGRRGRVRAGARQRRRRPGRRGPPGDGRGRADPARHRGGRHRRPARHRRRHDGPGRGDPGRGRPGRDAVRRRRDDRPGRGDDRAGVPGRGRVHRRRADQARRRRPRRRRPLGAVRDRPADHVRLHRREAVGLRRLPPRADGLAHPRHGRHPHPHRAGPDGLRRGRGRADGRQARLRHRLHPRGLPRADDGDPQDGPDLQPARHDAGDGSDEGPDRRHRRPGPGPDRGHHPVDDAGRAARPEDHQRLPPGPHRQGLRGPGQRRQRAGRPVLRGPQDDAADGRWDGAAGHAAERLQDPRQEGQEGQERPGTDAAEGARRDAGAAAGRAQPTAARHADAGPVQAQPAEEL
ncbi:MAG: Signal recognition particle protein Ffh, partial [uncultured Corynebacteriales bacterium]